MLNADKNRISQGSTINDKYLRNGTGSSGTDRSRLPWFVILLVCVKFLSSTATFLLANVFTSSSTNHVPLTADVHYPPTGIFGRWTQSFHTLAFIQLSSGVVFTIVQKPFASGSKVSVSFWEWVRIGRHAVISIVFLMIWTSGLQLSGPFRTIFVATQYDYTLAGIFTAFFVVKSGPRLRGAVLFIAGLCVLLLFDHDAPSASPVQPTVNRVADKTFVTKRSVGILVLIFSLVLKLGFNAFAKTLAADLGGSKKLHALSTLISGIMLFFLVLIDLIAGADLFPFRSNFFSLIFIVMFGFVASFYIDHACLKRMEASKVARIGSLGSQISALVLSLLWVSTDVPTVVSLVAFAFVCLGTFSLTATEKHPSGGGSFVGYSSDGLPLFSFSNQAASEGVSMWKDVVAWMLSLLRQIQDDGTSRKIFYFFLINLTFTCVEFLCGTLSNSLGLISDGFHMLFDTIALLIGLCASVMCRWPPTPIFPFGYGRVEIIAGFINSLFLLVVAVVVFFEAFQRLFDPPTLLETHRLLPVSIIGLVVNLCGILAFKNSTSVDHSHHNANIKGIFLHILADTIGSIGVIISSFAIHQWGILIVDPVCSIIVATLVTYSTNPSPNLGHGRCSRLQESQVLVPCNRHFHSHFVVQVEKDEFISSRNKNTVDIEEDPDIDPFRKAEFVMQNRISGMGSESTNVSTFEIALV
ncbi:unnamed protein product [Allacma fusca]|uniref:Cation efflux protein transmembrane domain-containing protein n=1 Tax=Allacma fusca TaxID=39272 RepID=A0A8J2PIY6_9HEXA|nr:unnamed protein product [Allacma fusca]